MATARPKADREDDEELLPELVWVEPEEGRRMFDQAAQAMVGMSGEEFIRRYDAGEYAHIPDDAAHRNIVELALLIPFGR